MVVAPSDHIVLKEETFLQKIRQALDFVGRQDALVTLGIQPSRPDTGYGYIQYAKTEEGGVHPVERFTEKPDLVTARQFVDSGEYLWNAGIFVWKANAVLNAFQHHAPEVFQILQKGLNAYNTPAEPDFLREYYPATPNISVDFAIMEKAPNVYTIPAEFGWSDLGTWASLHAECPQDERGNVLQGHVLALDVRNSLVRAPKDKLVVLKDLDDYIVVDESDVLLIYPKSKEQEIKQVTTLVKERFGDTYL